MPVDEMRAQRSEDVIRCAGAERAGERVELKKRRERCQIENEKFFS
jgi:hypothetical protein